MDVARVTRLRRALAPTVILVASLALRLRNFGAPFVYHEFRQTQTAITVRAFLEDGVSVLRYHTPIFGPPWTVPFEFPTYQLTVYPLARLGVPLDVACRMVGLAWFYASAVLLFLLVRRWAGAALSTAALAVYVSTPFSIVWSRAALIDYASVALSLAYVLLVSWWAASRRAVPAVLATTVGALAYLTKITTVAAFLPAVVAVLVVGWSRGRRSESGTPARVRSCAVLIGWMAVMLALPLAAGAAWTRWTDHVKASAAATVWLTSDRLTTWSFGTLAQRASLSNWATIGDRIAETIVPGYVALGLGLALVFAGRRRGPAAVAVLVSLAGAFGAIATFFNLYWVHDYYLIAVTAPLAVLTAAGLVELASWLRFPGRTVAVAGLVFLAAWCSPYRERFLWYTREPFRKAQAPDEFMRLAHDIDAVTPRDRWVVIEGDDYNPRLLYWSNRRGFMLSLPWMNVDTLAPVASRPEWATLVCKRCPPDLLALWPDRRLLGQRGRFTLFDLSRTRWPL